MKEPVPPKGTPAGAPHPHPSPRPEPLRVGGAQEQLVIRFFRRMRLQRVYPLAVAPRQPPERRPVANVAAAPLQLRPVIPGAHVSPAESELAIGRPEARSTFAVTPLAKGKLHGARLEVHHQGKLVQEIPLSMTASNQVLTWFLLILTVLVPGLIFYLTVHHDLTRQAAKEAFIDKQLAANKAARLPPGQVAPKGPDAAKGEGQNKKPAEADQQAGELMPTQVLGPVEREIIDAFPDERIVHTRIAPAVQNGYEWLYKQTRGGTNLIFYVAVVLLALTVISWFGHSSRRGRRRSKPIVLAP